MSSSMPLCLQLPRRRLAAEELIAAPPIRHASHGARRRDGVYARPASNGRPESGHPRAHRRRVACTDGHRYPLLANLAPAIESCRLITA